MGADRLDALDALDAKGAVLFDEGDGVGLEVVAGNDPDVILAGYSGISQQDHKVPSQIAPVTGCTEAVWTTTWRETLRQTAAGIGIAKEGDALMHRLGERSGSAARHPERVGKTGVFVTHLAPRDLSTIGFHLSSDRRVQVLQDLGIGSSEAVHAASKAQQYPGRISANRGNAFDDVEKVVTHGDSSRLMEVEENPLIVRVPVVAHDAFALLGNDAIGTAANPTPL